MLTYFGHRQNIVNKLAQPAHVFSKTKASLLKGHRLLRNWCKSCCRSEYMLGQHLMITVQQAVVSQEVAQQKEHEETCMQHTVHSLHTRR